MADEFDFTEKSVSFHFKPNSIPTFDFDNNPLTSWSSLTACANQYLVNGGSQICISNVNGVDLIWMRRVGIIQTPDPTKANAMIEKDRWYHVTAIYSPDTIKLHLDGELSGQYEYAIQIIPLTGAHHMVVGSGRNENIRYLTAVWMNFISTTGS